MREKWTACEASMHESEILSSNSEGTADVEQLSEDRARPKLSGVGSPTLVARLDVVADHADHLFRLHPPCRVCAQVPRYAIGGRRDDHRHSDRPVCHCFGVSSHRHLRQQGQFQVRPADPQDCWREPLMRKISWLLVTLLICFPTVTLAAGAIDGGSKQAVNWAAIGMRSEERRVGKEC